MPTPLHDPRLEIAGLRQTQAARALLQWWDQHPGLRATHADVMARWIAEVPPPNRVTLYRLLDKLAQAGVLQRHPDEQTRVWRYSLAHNGHEIVAPRFECDACHQRFELTQAKEPTQEAAHALIETLAALGHHGQRVELAVHGTCAHCQSPDKS